MYSGTKQDDKVVEKQQANSTVSTPKVVFSACLLSLQLPLVLSWSIV